MSATLGESGSLQFLPNLPGFKAKGAVITKKKKYFSKQGETVFCSDPEETLPQLGDGDEANMGASILAIGMTRKSGASTSRMTSADIVNMKLAFQAFFEETAGKGKFILDYAASFGYLSCCLPRLCTTNFSLLYLY